MGLGQYELLNYDHMLDSSTARMIASLFFLFFLFFFIQDEKHTVQRLDLGLTSPVDAQTNTCHCYNMI